MAKFFVPYYEADKYEEGCQQMAAVADAAPLPLDDRIYSMTWRHDGVVWTATVGQTLRGLELVTVGRGRARREREVARSTNDIVLAIFPGEPGRIVHDNKSRVWNLPIHTGQAIQTTKFQP